MVSRKQIFETVLKRVRPDQKKIQEEVDNFLKKINSEIKKNKIKATAVVGGSIAKDTNLKGDHDCDVFVRFDYAYKDKDISKLLAKALRPFKPELVHGSRDYFQIDKGINYELVPVLNIDTPKKAVNVTDMSPLHVDWVKEHSGFSDEIRLAKLFCKSAGVYGAESYIKGFSGHVLDILTIHYGGFIKLLKASKDWKVKTVVDPENHFKGDALKKLNRSKIDSALIVIDPVLPERNAAAALGVEKFDKFKACAEAFLTKPSEEFFKIKEVTEETLQKEHKKNLIILSAKPLKGKTDVVGAKLLKAFTCVQNTLRFNDFDVVESGWYWDKENSALFWFVLKHARIIPLKKHLGPPEKAKGDADAFRKKHNNTFFENGRVCAYVKRKYVGVVNLLDDFEKDGSLWKDKLLELKVVEVPKGGEQGPGVIKTGVQRGKR